MKKIVIAVLIIFLSLTMSQSVFAASSEKPAAKPDLQSSITIVPVWELFYTKCSGSSPCQYWEDVQAICDGSSPIGFYTNINTGTIDYGTGYLSNDRLVYAGNFTSTFALVKPFYLGADPGASYSGMTPSKYTASAGTIINQVLAICPGTETLSSTIDDVIDSLELRQTSMNYFQCDGTTCKHESEIVAACGTMKPAGTITKDGWDQNKWFFRNPVNYGTTTNDLKARFAEYRGDSNLNWYSTNVGDLVEYYTYTQTGTQQAEKQWVWCYDPGKMQTNVTCQNVIGDGDMEQNPISAYWFPVSGSSGNRYEFGRYSSANAVMSGLAGTYLDVACGVGGQIIGNFDCELTPYDSIRNFECRNLKAKYADIRQRITWPGGTMYYKYTARGQPEGGWDRNIHLLFYLTNLGSYSQTVISDAYIPPDWTTKTGSIGTIAPGMYNVYLILGSGNAQGDSFAIDDVALSTCPMDGTACSPVIPATTVTPTPGAGTPTATVTPVVPSNVIDNCGFDRGETGWQWQQNPITGLNKSFVIYGSNNYAHAEFDAAIPAISQAFFWGGGQMFVQFDSQSARNVYIRNRSTGQTYLIDAGDQISGGWIQYRGTNWVPAGSYDIVLHRPSGMAFPVEYDNVTVSAGNYVSCPAGTNWTPTPPPQATTTSTATMFPTATQRYTSTVMAGTATSTPRPTNTPFPTYTLAPTLANTITPRPYATNTPYPTYTQRPTYTPQPTYTPNSEGTIEPSLTPTATQPPQPPPDYYSDCQRPDTGDVSGWIEYNRCIALSFFTWSPKAEATIIAMPTLVSGKEPFGTINELQDTNNQIKEMVDSYDWNTGMPGTDDVPDPSIFLNPGPDNPWFSGQIQFTQGTGTPISTECTTRVAAVLGPYLGAGYCWLVNFLRAKGITPWLQLLVNIAALGFLVAYLIRKWIDAGSNSG